MGSDAESLPGDESLPDADAESLPDLMTDSDNDCHTVSVVAPIPGNERCTEQSDSDAESLPGMCCPHQCCQNIQSRCPAELQEWQNLRSKLSNDEVNEFIYRLLTVMRVAKSDQKGHRSYRLFGQCVCRNAFRDCIGMGNNKLSKFQRWLRNGYVHPPRDLRHSTPKERTVAWEECDTALQWAYDVLAEYINNDIVHPTDREVDAIVPSALTIARSKLRQSLDEPIFLALPTLDGLHEWVHGPGATVGSTAANAGSTACKWLSPMALLDLFDISKLQMKTTPSYITFFRCYREKWHSCLRFRSKILQSKCDDCERFKLLRKQAVTPEHASAVRKDHLEHVKSSYLDRAVDERIQKAAYDAMTTPGGVTLARSILNMDIDGMEAKKFKCPRNIGAAKSMAGLWRPEQHMVGGMVDGGQDYYWLVPPDIQKNANLSATLTADLLHRTVTELDKKGIPVPRTFRVHSDNATGEIKNQTYMKFMAKLAHDRFNSTEMTQFRTGHSHGRIDQSFSVIGSGLNKEGEVLETPSDFVKLMQETREKARPGARPMCVIELGATYDWKSYFEPLKVAPHGHGGVSDAMKEKNLDVCHVFRFFRRDSDTAECGQVRKLVTEARFEEEEPSPDDIILVTKHFIGSESVAQKPLVFCPGNRFSALAAEGPQPISGRVQFSQRQQAEFVKTANAIKKVPYKMLRAEAWLKALVDANLQGYAATWVPPIVSWVVSGNGGSVKPEPVPRALPSTTPIPVTVKDVSTPNRSKPNRKRALSETLAPAAQRINVSQRDQNLTSPSACQAVAGAPAPKVNEAGAPEHVAAPRPPCAVPLPSNGASQKRPHFSLEAPRSQFMCRTGVTGRGSSVAMKWGPRQQFKTQLQARKAAEQWVSAECAKRGFQKIKP